MQVTQLNHMAIHVKDLAASCDFYANVLKLEKLPRPNFDFPGAWYALGEGQELHLINKNLYELPDHPAQYHFALMVDDIDSFEDILKENEIEYRRQTRPDNYWQIFFQDPDGHTIELTAPPEN